jgi:phosphoribosyl 1,2-cyclic phosphate phosphodiesterase
MTSQTTNQNAGSDNLPDIPSRQMSVTFLGTGTSHGIPMIGCDCPVCHSSDPRDKRFRTSVAIGLPAGGPTAGRVILIDTPPEFRLGALACNLRRVDAILFTHAHADHIMGLDDIRRYNDIAHASIPAYGDQACLDTVRRCFAHLDRPFTGDGWPSVDFRTMEIPTEVCGLDVVPIPLLHGRQQILGYRIGKFAYCTDCSAIPDASIELLANLDVLVIDGLRYTPHPTHFNLEQALAVIAALKPRRSYLTHIAHQISHAKTSLELPAGVAIACDGLTIQAAI